MSANRAAIRVQRGAIKEIPFCRTARRVANHPGPATYERNRATARKLQTPQCKDAHQVPNMKRIRARVKANVGGNCGIFCHSFIQPSAHLMDEAALGEVGEQVGAIRSDHDPMLPSER